MKCEACRAFYLVFATSLLLNKINIKGSWFCIFVVKMIYLIFSNKCHALMTILPNLVLFLDDFHRIPAFENMVTNEASLTTLYRFQIVLLS